MKYIVSTILFLFLIQFTGHCQEKQIYDLFGQGVKEYNLERHDNAFETFIKVDSLIHLCFDSTDVRNDYHLIYICDLLRKFGQSGGHLLSYFNGYKPIDMTKTKDIDKVCNSSTKSYLANDYQTALNIRKKAAEKQKKRFGESSFCYIKSLEFIGDCYDSLNNIPRAIDYRSESYNIQKRVLDSTKNYDYLLSTIGQLYSLYTRWPNHEKEVFDTYIEYAKVLSESAIEMAWFNTSNAETSARQAMNMILNYYPKESREYADVYFNFINTRILCGLMNRGDRTGYIELWDDVDVLKDYVEFIEICEKINYTDQTNYYDATRSLVSLYRELGDDEHTKHYLTKVLETYNHLPLDKKIEYRELVSGCYPEKDQQRLQVLLELEEEITNRGLYYSEKNLEVLESISSYYFVGDTIGDLESVISIKLKELEIKKVIDEGHYWEYANRKLLELNLLLLYVQADIQKRVEIEELRCQLNKQYNGENEEYAKDLLDLGLSYININQNSKGKEYIYQAISIEERLNPESFSIAKMYGTLSYVYNNEGNVAERERCIEQALRYYRNAEHMDDIDQYRNYLVDVSKWFNSPNIQAYHKELLSLYEQYFSLTSQINNDLYRYLTDQALTNIYYYQWEEGDELTTSKYEEQALAYLDRLKENNNSQNTVNEMEGLVCQLSGYYYVSKQYQKGLDVINYFQKRFPNVNSYNILEHKTALLAKTGEKVELLECYKKMHSIIQSNAKDVMLYNTTHERAIIWSKYFDDIDYINYMILRNYPYSYCGIGITYEKDSTGVVIVDVAEGGPAENSNIMVGDVILSINGKKIEQSQDINTIRDMFRGFVGSNIILDLRKKNDDITTATITKSLIKYYDQDVSINDPEDLNCMQVLFDLSLLRKNYLLTANVSFNTAVINTGDSTLIYEYKDVIKQKQYLNQIQGDESVSPEEIETEKRLLEQREFNVLKKTVAINNSSFDVLYDWNSIREKLDDNDFVIEFISYTRKDHNYCAAIGGGKEDSIPVFITQFDENLLGYILDSTHRFTEQDARIIDELIWEPIGKYTTSKKRIYFSTDGILNALPIENMTPVTNTHSSKQLYRLSSLRQICMNKEERGNYEKAILMGGIDYGANIKKQIDANGNRCFSIVTLIPSNKKDQHHFDIELVDTLKWTRVEVDSIYNLFQKRNISVNKVTDTLATETYFKQLSGTDVDVIHLATHGFFINSSTSLDVQVSGNDELTWLEDGQMNNSGVLLAGVNNTLKELINNQVIEHEDGLLTSQEIAALSFPNLSLVSLSACQTGLGDINGEGVYGLQRGFKIAGAQSILMTLWKVDDEATCLLMNKFYEKLLEGCGEYEALKTAQEYLQDYELDSSEGDYYGLSLQDIATQEIPINNKVKPFRDPYYWAGFILLDALH